MCIQWAGGGGGFYTFGINDVRRMNERMNDQMDVRPRELPTHARPVERDVMSVDCDRTGYTALPPPPPPLPVSYRPVPGRTYIHIFTKGTFPLSCNPRPSLLLRREGWTRTAAIGDG